MSDTPRTDAVLKTALTALQAATDDAGFVVALKTLVHGLGDESKAIERELHASRAVLQLIAYHGGTTDDEGCSCNGLWCAEQARAFLDTANAEPHRSGGAGEDHAT